MNMSSPGDDCRGFLFRAGQESFGLNQRPAIHSRHKFPTLGDPLSGKTSCASSRRSI